MKRAVVLMAVMMLSAGARADLDWDWGDEDEDYEDDLEWEWEQGLDEEAEYEEDEDEDEDEYEYEGPPGRGLPFELRLGIKGAFPASLWTAPDNAPSFFPYDLYWNRQQFFIGWGGGAFAEAIVLKHLSVELGCLFEDNSLAFNQPFRDPSWPAEMEWDYYTRFKQLRFALLAKGRLPLSEAVEITAGMGPEFVLGLDAHMTVKRQTELVAGGEMVDSALDQLYQAEKANGFALAFDVGAGIKVWKLIIPISLRAGVNLAQPGAYDERVTVDITDTVTLFETPISKGKVKAVESINFALLAGVGYVMGAKPVN